MLNDEPPLATVHCPALSDVEKRDLARLELDVEAGLLEFRRAGLALQEIRERKLHRENYPTFDAYTKDRWGCSRRRADQLIAAAELVDLLTLQTGTTGSQLPASERQARELLPVPEADRPAVWEAAVKAAGGKQPTAAEVRAAVEEWAEAEALAALSPEKRAQLQEEREQRLREHSKEREAVEEDEANAAKLQRAIKAGPSCRPVVPLPGGAADGQESRSVRAAGAGGGAGGGSGKGGGVATGREREGKGSGMRQALDWFWLLLGVYVTATNGSAAIAEVIYGRAWVAGILATCCMLGAFGWRGAHLNMKQHEAERLTAASDANILSSAWECED